MSCKLCANYLHLVFKLCAISEQIVCKHRHTDTNTSCCTSRVTFMAKTDMPSPVYCGSVHKTSLLYKCTQNQFMVQVYTKSVHCASVHKISLLYKTSLLVNNERNVHGQNNSKECTGTEHYQGEGMYRDGTLPRLRNVQGRNITKVKECTGTEHYHGFVYITNQ